MTNGTKTRQELQGEVQALRARVAELERAEAEYQAKDHQRLREIAERYGVSLDELLDQADSYESRPPFIIDVAKGRLRSWARLLGEIVERKRTERALQETEERHRQLFEEARDGIFLGDAETGVIVDCNRAASELVGRDRSELIGQHQTILHPPCKNGKGATFSETFAQHLGDKEGQVLETQVITKTGEIKEVAIKASLLDLNGKTVLQGLFRDITDRKRAEEELARYRDHLEELVEERTRQLEASRLELQRAQRLASIGTLAAGIAHEINNPLGLILMSAQRALEKGDDPKAVETSLHSIKDDVKRCARIVKSVLQFSREQSSDKWPVDVNQVVRRSEEFTREYGKRHGVRVHFEPASGLPAVVANATELEQAFVNLIRNAVEACSDPQTVTLRTERAPVGVRITIADQGRGMTAEVREHAFDPFYTTRQQRGGTGLGLSIVHGIITDQGGTIEIESQPGKGTRVIVGLPVDVPGNNKE